MPRGGSGSRSTGAPKGRRGVRVLKNRNAPIAYRRTVYLLLLKPGVDCVCEGGFGETASEKHAELSEKAG